MKATTKQRPRIRFLVFGLLLSAFFLLTSHRNLSSGQEHQEQFLQTYSLSQTGTFELRNVNGLNVITTWPEEKVEVKAIKKTKRDPKNLQLVKIEVQSSADRLTVETVYPRLRNTGVSVDYEIKLPERLAETILKVVNGRVEVTGPINKLKASTVNGDIQAEKVEGPADLSTTNGQVEATLIGGPSKIEAVNGRVACRLLSLAENLSVETVNGAVELRIDPEIKLNAYLEARTVNGGISVDVPVLFQNLSKSRGSLEGQVGNGGPLIRLRTVNGSIRLTK